MLGKNVCDSSFFLWGACCSNLSIMCTDLMSIVWLFTFVPFWLLYCIVLYCIVLLQTYREIIDIVV